MSRCIPLLRRSLSLLVLVGLVVATAACTTTRSTVYFVEPPVVHGADEPVDTVACERVGLDPADVAELKAKPLHQFNEAEVDRYLRYLDATMPDPIDRQVHLARKNLGQPYEIYLLGEAPFEFYDPNPLYCLDRGDCVVFTEHMLAMSRSSDWATFFPLLQRIRYKEGQIGVATRNHYTEADWNVSNEWLVEDITRQVGGDRVNPWSMRINLSNFLRNRYGVESEYPVRDHEDVYIPYEAIPEVEHLLQPGDVVNIVRGNGDGRWVGHVGMITRDDDGQTMFLHSTQPASREEPLATYIERSIRNREENLAAGKTVFHGFKFLRPRENALENLRALDGDATPRLRVPGVHPTPVELETANASE